ncbi:MAG TPA: zinc ribbon domain-containing protein [Candidatus Acidoferrales bacterium]|jgi:hypothetical protein
MTTNQQRSRVIPVVVWVIAVVVYLFVSTAIFNMVIPQDKEMSQWPLAGKIALCYGLLLIVPAWILLIGYVFGDSKRRNMRYIVWTLLAIFVPDGIGIILYFILRDPLSAPCPGCGAAVKASFTFCPKCATSLHPTCPQCGRAIERGWSHCPGCGTKVPAATLPAT